jgi:GAF domain
MPPRNLPDRVIHLERSLAEVVAALGMLVSELSLRRDLELQTPVEVEEALDRSWQALVGADALLREAVPTPDDDAAHALADAVEEAGAAVAAMYDIRDGRAELVASVGYPAEVMESFRSFDLDAPLPVAEAARTGRPLWFHDRGQILDEYPHLREDHERTEVALGREGVQGAALPLRLGDVTDTVVLFGFTYPTDLHAAHARLAALAHGVSERPR